MCMVLLLICMVIGLIVANTLGFNPGEDLFTLDCTLEYNKARKECLEAQSMLEDQAASQEGAGSPGQGGAGPAASNSTRREYRETASPFLDSQLHVRQHAATLRGASPVAESVEWVLRRTRQVGRRAASVHSLPGSAAQQSINLDAGKHFRICLHLPCAFASARYPSSIRAALAMTLMPVLVQGQEAPHTATVPQTHPRRQPRGVALVQVLLQVWARARSSSRPCDGDGLLPRLRGPLKAESTVLRSANDREPCTGYRSRNQQTMSCDDRRLLV